MKYRTCVGIDTHSTKNEVFALDTETGEAWRATLSADPRDLGRFLCSLPVDRATTTCVYEAGPTGFGLARSLGLAGWPCVVAATSKLPQLIHHGHVTSGAGRRPGDGIALAARQRRWRPGANRVGILAHRPRAARATGESGATSVATADQPSRRHLVAATNPREGRRHADVRLFTEPDVGRHVVARAGLRGRSGSNPGGKNSGWIPFTS